MTYVAEDSRRSMSSTRTMASRVRVARDRAIVLLCALLAVPGCTGITEPMSEFATASQAAGDWVQRNPEGWTLDLNGTRPLERPQWSTSCARNPDSGFTVLRYASVATEIDLAFRCPVDGTAGIEDLAAAFSHAVLQKLPHGISSPGWSFHVSTPSSSVTETVTLSAPTEGLMRVVIHTPLYAVYGHSLRPSCQPPADAPSPEGCYLLIEHRVPLRLNLVVPFDGSVLD